MTAFSLSSVPATAFPFTALVGHEALQRALLLAAIDPGMGGDLTGGQNTQHHDNGSENGNWFELHSIESSPTLYPILLCPSGLHPGRCQTTRNDDVPGRDSSAQLAGPVSSVQSH